ncbi:hypothetical protein BH09BAC1_BH09BAC1_01010 [soil metagenome]
MQRRKSTLLVILTLFLVVAASSIVVTHPTQAPAGHTGAPGEFSCATSGCHSGSAVAATALELKNGSQPISTYTPGTSYNLVLNANAYNWANGRNGFEVTALDATNDSAGVLAVTSANSTIKDSTFNRQYITHYNPNNLTGSVAWVFKWTAPAAGRGTVTIYAAVNMSNGDNTSGGDRIYTQAFTLTEGITNPCTSFSAFISTPGNANSFCTGQSLTLTAGSTGGTGNATYSWSNGAGNNQTATVTSAGTYTVTVTQGACTATASLSVTSIAAGVAAFTTTVNENIVVINNSSTGVNGNYTWDFGDGSSPFADNSASFSYTYDSLGTYTISVTYTDVCGVVRTTDRPVTITTLPSVGVNQVSLANALSIYPNPFGGQASINLNGFDGATYQFTLVDITGRTVRNMEGIGGTPLMIDRNGLQSGMYFYSIQLQGQKAQGKLLID